ncbi:hypothetical protein Trydic_g14890 [Trypoxylus dichotomus]
MGAGVAMTFITNIFFHCIMNGLLLGDVSIYFLSSMRTTLQWMKCPEIVENVTCWDGTGCEKNCIGEFNKTSAYHFFVKIYMENTELNPIVTKIIEAPSLSRTALITTSWVMTCVLITAVSATYQKFFVKVWNITFCLLIFNMLASLISVPKDILANNLFKYGAHGFWYPTTWAMAFTRTIYHIGLGRPFHIMYGSYMAPTSSSGIRSSCAVFCSFIALLLASSFTRCSLLSLQHLANLDADHEKYVWNPGIATYFINLPFRFGLTTVPHFWLLQYFFMFMCILINNQLSHIFAFEKVVTEYYPVLIKYRRYILGGIAVISGLISVCVSSRETYLVYKSVTVCVSENIEIFNALLLSVLVCYIYGVQKLCDDVDFMRGAQPSQYWKFCWYVLPVMLGISFSYRKSVKLHSDVYENIEKWIFIILILPIPTVAVIEILKYIRRRNILGLLQSSEHYGPPDPTERYLRRMYNPRKETRSSRKREICLHSCLLNNKIIKKIEAEELYFKQASSSEAVSSQI